MLEALTVVHDTGCFIFNHLKTEYNCKNAGSEVGRESRLQQKILDFSTLLTALHVNLESAVRLLDEGGELKNSAARLPFNISSLPNININ